MRNNFVAKHCRTFNRATVQRDRTKYHRPTAGIDRYWEEYWDEEEIEQPAIANPKELETPSISQIGL